MRVGFRLGALIAVFMALVAGLAAAQGAATSTADPGLKQRVERRFDVLPIQGGVVLKPKRTSAVRVIEISLVGVDLPLDPRFVPVKRLDKVVLGYHSHRTVDKPLVLCKMSEEAKKAKQAAATDLEQKARELADLQEVLKERNNVGKAFVKCKNVDI